jgi:ribosomal protein L7/L12
MPSPDTPLPANVLEAIQQGNTIEAIKRLRLATGLGLKEAKDVIDRHLAGSPVQLKRETRPTSVPAAVTEALNRGNKIEAIRLMREATSLGLKEAKDAVEAHGLSPTSQALAPGEVPRSNPVVWVVIALVAVALMAYYFVTGP